MRNLAGLEVENGHADGEVEPGLPLDTRRPVPIHDGLINQG